MVIRKDVAKQPMLAYICFYASHALAVKSSHREFTHTIHKHSICFKYFGPRETWSYSGSTRKVRDVMKIVGVALLG